MPRLGLDWRDGCSITPTSSDKKRQPKGYDKEAKLEAAKRELAKITGDKKSKLISVEPIVDTKTEVSIQPSEDDYLKALTYTFDDETLPIKGSSNLVAGISPGFDRFGIHILIVFTDGKTHISHKWS